MYINKHKRNIRCITNDGLIKGKTGILYKEVSQRSRNGNRK